MTENFLDVNTDKNYAADGFSGSASHAVVFQAAPEGRSRFS
jgi:hypothetical protein